jgi:hypothetical protein
MKPGAIRVRPKLQEAVRMNRLLARGLVGAGLLVLGVVGAQAQYRDDGRFRYGDRSPERGLFDRVRVDLDRAISYGWISGGDRRRLYHARERLGDFVGKLYRGRYDKGQLDDVIGTIQSAVNHNGWRSREMEILQDDANRLRDFRARGPGYR